MPVRTLLRRCAAGAAGVTAAALLVPVPPATGVPAGLPDSVPPAARADEPRLPAAAGWPFSERHFPRTSGTGRLHGGALFWSSFVYDDHGPSGPQGFTAPGPANLAPSQGMYTYPTGPARNNGADIFRTAVGRDADASYWRVDWTTLVDPEVPIAVWTFDGDHDPSTGRAAWPAGAGVTSPGIDTALVVSARGAWLVELAEDRWVDVVRHGGQLSVDRAAGSFVVRLPDRLMPVTGHWRVRVAAGLADATGRGLAEPHVTGGLPPQPGATRVYDVGFRSVRQEPPVFRSGRTDALVAAFEQQAASTPPWDQVGADGLARFVTGNFWMEDHQADSLARGDVSEFAETVDWAQLDRQAHTAEPRPTGYSNRWYVSRLDLGQGVLAGREHGNDLAPNFLGRIQPYAVYVPRDARSTQLPLTWVLHSLGVNHNQYGALDPRLLRQLCEGRGSVCATTLGHGPDGWYFDEAEVDYWSVWRELAEAYRLDPQRTVITGYSMGGYATYKLGLAHPDLYAAAVSLAGPPVCGIALHPDQGSPTFQHARCRDSGATGPLVRNARWVPYRIGQGTFDQLVPFVSVEQQVQRFDELGLRHRFVRYPGEDHMAFATQDRFDTVVDGLGLPTAPRDPGRVDFSWFPHLDRPELGLQATGAYWVGDVAAHDRGPGDLAHVTARSFARPDPRHEAVRSGPTPVLEPLPAVATALAWRFAQAPEPRRLLILRLDNVARLSVDMQRAGLRCGAVRVRTTDPVTLHLVHLPGPDEQVRIDGEQARIGLPC